MTPEGRLKQRAIKYLRDVGCFVWPVADRYRAGLPDIIASANGTFLAIELKTPRGRLSRIQSYTLEEIRAAGGIAGVARSLEEVKAFAKYALEMKK